MPGYPASRTARAGVLRFAGAALDFWPELCFTAMPPLPVINDAFRCTLVWSNLFSGVKPRNVLHIASASLSATQVGETLIDAIVANPATYSMMPAPAILQQVDVLPLDGVSGTVAVVGNASSVVTTGSGSEVPESAIRITLYTGLAGPRHRGRQFIGPLTEDNISNGDYAPTIGTVTTAWNDLVDDIDSISGGLAALAVASYVHADMNPVTSCLARTDLGTQVRRLRSLR